MTRRPPPSVSVVIPVRDDAVALADCLRLLAAQRVRPLEVVVVDNASTDDSADVARRHGARVVTEARVGIPYAAAAGYDAAVGDVIARCDADSRPGPRWVGDLARRMRDPRLSAVSGVGRFHDLPPGLRRPVAAAYLGAYYVLSHLAVGHTVLWGSNMALRRTAWLAVRDDVHRTEDVHDDMDLAFALAPPHRTRLVRTSVPVSARWMRGSRRRRMQRAVRTIELCWAVRPPWLRWQDRYQPSISQISSWVSRKPTR